jgi:hypothetical protein
MGARQERVRPRSRGLVSSLARRWAAPRSDQQEVNELGGDVCRSRYLRVAQSGHLGDGLALLTRLLVVGVGRTPSSDAVSDHLRLDRVAVASRRHLDAVIMLQDLTELDPCHLLIR